MYKVCCRDHALFLRPVLARGIMIMESTRCHRASPDFDYPAPQEEPWTALAKTAVADEGEVIAAVPRVPSCPINVVSY